MHERGMINSLTNAIPKMGGWAESLVLSGVEVKPFAEKFIVFYRSELDVWQYIWPILSLFFFSLSFFDFTFFFFFLDKKETKNQDFIQLA